MVCRVADNPALESLRKNLGLERFCHSQRVDCIHRLPRATEPSYYGISGAFMGYCQALFQRKGSLSDNTNRIAHLLYEDGLPWARSHELFLGYRMRETIQEFVQQAASPLSNLGRVPILITGIDVSNETLVGEILDSPIDVVNGETVLVRLIVDGPESTLAAAKLIQELVRRVEVNGTMPKWWPLLQAGKDPKNWFDLRTKLGGLWKYVNVAVNPFTDAAIFEIVRDQIMVAQFVVPSLDDITLEGDVRVSNEMTIYGARAGDAYSIPELVANIAELDSWPTCIFLGPSLPEWSDEINLQRIRRAVHAFTLEARGLWEENGLSKYASLWQMAA